MRITHSVQLILISILFLISTAFSDIINVPGDVEAIADAIEDAEDGDTVLVAPGIYPVPVNFDGKDITVASLMLTTGDSSYIDSTFIDGQRNGRSGVVFRNGETEDALLMGFTVQNCSTDYGGGIYINDSAPTLRNLRITKNETSQNGGGTYVTHELSKLILDHVLIDSNIAGANGGGVACFESDEVRIVNSQIVGNSASESGGGIFVDLSELQIDNSLIDGNYAGESGGGVRINQGSVAFLTDTEIRGNEGRNGRSAFSAGIEELRFIRVLMHSNKQGENGSYTTMILGGGSILQNCTFADNIDTLGCLHATGGNMRIINSIFTNSSEIEVTETGVDTEVEVSYCVIDGGEDAFVGNIDIGEGIIDEDPLFVDPDNSDYHLQVDSPCLDAGDPNSPRDEDGTVADIGAFAFLRWGSLFGQIVDAATGEPIENAVIATTLGQQAITDTAGLWKIPAATIGLFDITAYYQGYLDSSYSEQELSMNDTLQFDFALLHTVPLLVPDTIVTSLELGDSTRFELLLSNNGNGPLGFSAKKKMRNGIPKWTLRQSINVDDNLDVGYYQGATFIGENFYISAGIRGEAHYIYMLDREGAIADSFPQFVADDNRYGYSDLTWDSSLLWGIANDQIHGMTLNGDLENSFLSPSRRTVFLTWDRHRELLWVAEAQDMIWGIDAEGNVMDTLEYDARYRSLVFMPDDPEGYNLHVIYEDINFDVYRMFKVNTLTGDSIGLWSNPNFFDGRSYYGASLSPHFDRKSWVLINVDRGGDSLNVWQYGDYINWMRVDVAEGVVNPQDTTSILLDLFTVNLDSGFFPGMLDFAYSSRGGVQLMIDMTVYAVDEVKEDAAVPNSFVITSVYPNPFNSMVRIEYSAPRSENASLWVHDLSGRLVDSIDLEPANAGSQSCVWDAASIPAGVYFIQLKADNATDLRKVVLLK